MQGTKRIRSATRAFRIPVEMDYWLGWMADQRGTSMTDVVMEALDEYLTAARLEERVRVSALANMKYPTADAFKDEMQRQGDVRWHAMYGYSRGSTFEKFVEDMVGSYVREWRKKAPDRKAAFVEFVLEMEFYCPPELLNMPLPFSEDEQPEPTE